MCVWCICENCWASEVPGSTPFHLNLIIFVFVALMKLNDEDQSVLQVTAASLITILWGLMVVFPFVQVSELLDHEVPFSGYTTRP